MVAKTKKAAPAAVKATESVSVFGGNANAALIRYVERIERVTEEIAVSNQDLKEIFSECKGEGFDTAILRKVLRLRQMDPAKRQEQEALISLYEDALSAPATPFERAEQPGDTADD